MAVLGRLRSVLGGRTPTGPGRSVVAPEVHGIVEQFTTDLVVGWVAVPEGSGPVQVELYLNKLRVMATYATPAESGKADGSWRALRLDTDQKRQRYADTELRTFSLRVVDLWRFANRSSRLSVRVGGRPLPIHGHGLYRTAAAKGESSVQELRGLFEDGYVFSQYGWLQRSKKLDTIWQENVHAIYERADEVIEAAFGYRVFGVYGTLLGAVREGGYLGHDLDFDAAYLSAETDGARAASELVEVALALIDAGLDVDCKGSLLHVLDPARPGFRIDLFHVFFDEEGALSFPFGMAGHRSVTREEWTGLKEVELPGGRVQIPAQDELVLEQLYGADWRQPKPGFNWKLDRTHAVPGARTTPVQKSKVYWANFYSRHSLDGGSTFFDFVSAYDGIPARVVDIGCGDGRDSCAFGETGRTVLGLDRSHVGVAHAVEHAAARGLGESVRFQQCDVGDAEHLTRVLTDALEEAGDEPVLFYLRFFLHSIPEEVQATLMAILATSARPGDHLAAEFRTDADADQDKVYEQHYRRFQSGSAFGEALAGEHGFELLFEHEGTGLSPYKGEDPVLYRVVARR